DMTLRAMHCEPAIDAAAPPDLHHVAELFDAGRFTHEAMMDLLAPRGERFEHLHRAIDARPFFITRDEQADRAFEAAGSDEPFRGRRKGRDGALHVGGTTSIKPPLPDRAFKGVNRP